MDKELFGLNTCCLKASDVRRTEASVCVQVLFTNNVCVTWHSAGFKTCLLCVFVKNVFAGPPEQRCLIGSSLESSVRLELTSEAVVVIYCDFVLFFFVSVHSETRAGLIGPIMLWGQIAVTGFVFYKKSVWIFEQLNANHSCSMWSEE